MKAIIYITALLLLSSLAFGLSQPITQNGKTYYVVTSADPNEDTGYEVCIAAGMSCVGYTEASSAVCKQAHPSATETSGLSGDESGVYCDGSPQVGACSAMKDTCLTCPTCTVAVDCGTEIGNLYREMYVECAPIQASSCKVKVYSGNTQTLFTEIPLINKQLQSCQPPLPPNTGIVLSDGETLVEIAMNNGKIKEMVLTITGGKFAGVRTGTATACKQKLETTEAAVDQILNSQTLGQTAGYLYSTGGIKLKGCGVLSSVKLFFVNPIAKFFVKKQAPQPSPQKPAVNCGNVGEQCNNRGCFSGICGSPREQNADGQWGYWDYECLAVSEWDAKCQGKGNSPPPWSCIQSVACK
ncbi:hypothetical protein H6504_00345 [Candidatus Woesearchaeota archaeon]|nr:hypothetical protein [Candidatus Woesearchaeota archaeon]